MDLGLGAYADNIPALIVLGGIVIVIVTLIVTLGIYMWKILPLKIEKMWVGKASSEKGSEAEKKTEVVKKGGIIPHLDKTLERMESKIDEVNSNMRDMETRINHIDKAAMMGIVYNRRIRTIDRLRAFDTYLRLDGNGLVAEDAIETLIKPNRDDWIRVTQESKIKPLSDNYYKIIAEIKEMISNK